MDACSLFRWKIWCDVEARTFLTLWTEGFWCFVATIIYWTRGCLPMYLNKMKFFIFWSVFHEISNAGFYRKLHSITKAASTRCYFNGINCMRYSFYIFIGNQKIKKIDHWVHTDRLLSKDPWFINWNITSNIKKFLNSVKRVNWKLVYGVGRAPRIADSRKNLHLSANTSICNTSGHFDKLLVPNIHHFPQLDLYRPS